MGKAGVYKADAIQVELQINKLIVLFSNNNSQVFWSEGLKSILNSFLFQYK